MKICIACSPGGHLTEAFQLIPSISKHNLIIFTIDAGYVKRYLSKHKTYLVENPGRNLLKFIEVIFQSLKTLIKERPKVIISFGAGVTLPLCLFGKLFFNSKLIYIECSAQVHKPSITGRIVYYFADLFFVQWQYLLEKYGRRAVYGGLLI